MSTEPSASLCFAKKDSGNYESYRWILGADAEQSEMAALMGELRKHK